MNWIEGLDFAQIRLTRAIVRGFMAEVEKRAEGNMLKTGRLEGAHYAAMKQVAAELETAHADAEAKRNAA